MSDLETLRVIHLAANRAVLGVTQYAGQSTRVDVPMRAVVAEALRLDTQALVLSHNHPSGDPTPSKADIAVTRHLAMVLEGLGIRLHDHIVVGHECRISFREVGLL